MASSTTPKWVALCGYERCCGLRDRPDGSDAPDINPCFNGIWSASLLIWELDHHCVVVLILVLMEYGLRDGWTDLQHRRRPGLNPCFNGIWSASALPITSRLTARLVLILVLMEYGLRG